jgi:hypothetical protein
MYSDTVTPASGKFGAFLIQQSPRGDAAPYKHGAKVLLWIGLIGASWAVMVAAGYSVWSAL